MTKALSSENNGDKKLTDKEYKKLASKIIDSIERELNDVKNSPYPVHLDDIGNAIGIACAKHLAEKNIFGYEKKELILGYEHGWSLMDGTHP